MRTIEIVGDNYFGHWRETRTSCRAIVVQNGRLLLAYETRTDQWMIPGGGLEAGESEAACVTREVAEETGCVIRPSECVLQLDEFYEDWKYVDRYFLGEVVGRTALRLTEREREVGMQPRWMPVDEIVAIFSRHQSYAATDEMRRGMYLREYTALKAILG